MPMRTSLLLALAATSLTACTDAALDEREDADRLSVSGERAYEVLRTAVVFSGDGIGIAGTTPETVTSFRVLLGERGGAEAFARLAAEATPEGRLFGLVGVQSADSARYDRLATPLRASTVQVSVMHGCIADRVAMPTAVAEIDGGAIGASIRGTMSAQ